jgi:FMN phosphatase YigB (HAD superfamily)
MKKDKVILTDADGVCLDWEYSFGYWMQRHGYTVKVEDVYEMDIKYDMPKPEMKRLIRMFNESAWIRKLPPLRDAIKYMKKLHEEEGYIFHCITSLVTMFMHNTCAQRTCVNCSATVCLRSLSTWIQVLIKTKF